MRDNSLVKTILLLTISSPFKPGTINRLSLDIEFEVRLLEVLTLLEFIDKAYSRGRDLVDGRVTVQTLGLGGLISSALRASMQVTGLKPMVGLVVASITLSTFKAIADLQGRSLRDDLRRLITMVLYRSSPEDSVRLVEGLEATGMSRLLLYLEDRGVTKGRIMLEALSLGSLYEILARIDTGFTLNLRDVDMILELSNRIAREKNVITAVSKAYLELSTQRGLLDVESVKFKSLQDFLKIDRSLRSKREDLDSLLGGVYIASLLASLERWPWL